MQKRKKKTKKHKAQISLFIIVGIIMVIIVAFFLYLVYVIQPEPPIPPIIETNSIEMSIDDCLGKTLKNGIYYIGQHGGYYEMPDKSSVTLTFSFVPSLEDDF